MNQSHLNNNKSTTRVKILTTKKRFVSLIFTIISNTKIYDFDFEKLTCLFKSSINFDLMK